MTTFEKTLDYGQAGESAIARWLRNKGFSVLPVYERTDKVFKGPMLFTPTDTLIAPDMFVFRNSGAYWVEAKHKTAFSWHRNTQQWTTGIDLRHYLDYCRVDDETPYPVYLMFLHEGGQAKDSPPNSPKGLFGNCLSYLRKHEHHRHPNFGRSGGVFWELKDLIRYPYETTEPITNP